MTEKERFRKFVRNGFRKDEELGIPYHLYCLAHAILIAVPLGFIVSAVFYAMDLRDLYGTVYAFNMGVIVFLMFELDIDWRIEKNEFCLSESPSCNGSFVFWRVCSFPGSSLFS